MSLLTICQDAANEVGVVPPTVVVGNTEALSRQFLRLAKKVGLRLMKAYPWKVLRSEQTFTAVAAQEQTSILPSDFDRFVPETFWDRDNNYLISGPVSAVEWQGFQANGYTDPQKKFIHRGTSIYVMPAPDGGETLAFEYVSKNWCQDVNSTAQANWENDTDTAIIDEELITRGLVWEYLTARSLPANAAAASYETYFETLIENDEPNSKILVAGDIFAGGPNSVGGSRHFSGTPTVSGSESVA